MQERRCRRGVMTSGKIMPTVHARGMILLGTHLTPRLTQVSFVISSAGETHTSEAAGHR
jgi:hypothetical protein